MRPRRIRRGELQGLRRLVHRQGGFNAATPNSAWRTVSQGQFGSWPNEPQCGHAEFGVENRMVTRCGARTTTSFNAATPNSAWRTEPTEAVETLVVIASMRPRRIRRGERQQWTWRRGPGFWLQCGHAEFGVEN